MKVSITKSESVDSIMNFGVRHLESKEGEYFALFSLRADAQQFTGSFDENDSFGKGLIIRELPRD
jgi:hypothetical protein